MPLLLHISTTTKIPREYSGMVSIVFPEMEIIERHFTFVSSTPVDGPVGSMVFKDGLPFVSYELKGDKFIGECEVDYGQRTGIILDVFFQAIRLGVLCVVDFFKEKQVEFLGTNQQILLPISRSLTWNVENQQEALHGVMCLACRKEEWLEKK